MFRSARIAVLSRAYLFGLLCAFAPLSLGLARDGHMQGSACLDTSTVRQLAQIFNSRDDGFHCLGIAVAGEAIKAIVLETHSSSREAASGMPAIRSREFPVALIESSYGAVLDGIPGHDAVILQGRFARPSTSAELVVRYLYNGIHSEYRQCAVSINRSQDAEWHLFNVLHQKVARIVVQTWALPLIGTVGIANLEGACSAA